MAGDPDPGSGAGDNPTRVVRGQLGPLVGPIRAAPSTRSRSISDDGR